MVSRPTSPRGSCIGFTIRGDVRLHVDQDPLDRRDGRADGAFHLAAEDVGIEQRHRRVGLNVQVHVILGAELADHELLDRADALDLGGGGRDLLDVGARRACGPSARGPPGGAARRR